MRQILFLTALPVLALGLMAAGPITSNSGSVSVITTGNAEAAACSTHAIEVANERMAPETAVQTCTTALEEEALSRHDRAATRNNRGVLYMTMSDFEDASNDFEAALRDEPMLGESWVNRGAAQVRMGNDREGVASIDKGLALGVSEPWRAYFNRALARENLGDLKGAYQDFVKAAELNPEWAAPKKELTRFTVKK
jgi:tetratricopeptide (TPR) repeat protein